MQVSTEHRGDVAVVTMDDGKKNAMTPAAITALEGALDEVRGAAAVVLAGRPGSFCAGFDMATMTGGDAEAIRHVALGGGGIGLRLWSFPGPLVAACTGHAFTIGAIWLCACDSRVGADGDFKIAMTETAMGVTLTPWALEPLAARLSNHHWVQTVVQSRVHDPASALEAGFLDEVAPPGDVVDRAVAVATELAALPPDAYAGNKLATRERSIEVMRADLAKLSRAQL